MTKLALTTCLLVLAAPLAARAQDETPTPPTVVVSEDGEVQTSADEAVTLAVRADSVDPEVLRRALERDLGVRVELVRDDGARVTVDMMNDGVVRLRVRRDDEELERQTTASDDPTRNAAAVSLIISNLVRDESGEILAMLRIETPDAEPAPTEEPPAEEPVEPEAEEPEALAEQLTPPPAPEPPPAPPEPRRIPFGLDFAPGVGFSSVFGGDARRRFSLGVVGALHGGLDGFGGSSVLDLGIGGVNGVQLAGVGAIATGPVRGVQGSGVLSVAGGVAGVQLGTVAISAGDIDGIQGSVVGIGGEVSGAQLSVIGINGGVQGFQASVVGVAAGDVRGAQAGVVNVADNVYGVQLGVINVAGGRVHGAQLGIINISEDADAAIGLVNVHARGRTQLRFTVDTNGLIDANLLHGGRYTHMIVRAGAIPFLSEPKAALGLGFGARAPISDDFHLDFELLASVLLDDDIASGSPDMLYEARVLAGIQLIDELALSVGVAYRLHTTRDAADRVEMGAPVLEHVLADNGDFLVRGWPSIIAGVEIF